MDIVPNAAFEASFPADAEFEHPPGCYLARRLQAELAAVASTVPEFDNWRDAGWSVVCEVEGRRFEVYFSGLDIGPRAQSWMLGIAPIGQPGSLRKLLRGDLARIRRAESHADDASEQDSCWRRPCVERTSWAMNADPRDAIVADPNELNWA